MNLNWKGFVLAFVIVLVIAAIVWKRKQEESSYEPKDLLKGTVYGDEYGHTDIPLETKFRDFYLALDQLEEIKKTNNKKLIEEAKNKCREIGGALSAEVATYDADPVWFIKINEILANLDKPIVKT